MLPACSRNAYPLGNNHIQRHATRPDTPSRRHTLKPQPGQQQKRHVVQQQQRAIRSSKQQQRRTEPFHAAGAIVHPVIGRVNPVPTLLGQPVEHARNPIAQSGVIRRRVQQPAHQHQQRQNQKTQRQQPTKSAHTQPTPAHPAGLRCDAPTAIAAGSHPCPQRQSCRSRRQIAGAVELPQSREHPAAGAGPGRKPDPNLHADGHKRSILAVAREGECPDRDERGFANVSSATARATRWFTIGRGYDTPGCRPAASSTVLGARSGW